MKKNKSNQERIDALQQRIRSEQSRLRNRINILENRHNRLSKIGINLQDPHALIPNKYKNVEDWLTGHPFPNTVLSMIYRNFAEARQVSYSCYTYQYDYHIVKCEPKECYRSLLKKEESI